MCVPFECCERTTRYLPLMDLRRRDNQPCWQRIYNRISNSFAFRNAQCKFARASAVTAPQWSYVLREMKKKKDMTPTDLLLSCHYNPQATFL